MAKEMMEKSYVLRIFDPLYISPSEVDLIPYVL